MNAGIGSSQLEALDQGVPTGFDDILLAEYANPALTTVHQPANRLGSMLAELLLNTIQGEPVPDQHIIITPSLVVRNSTAFLP